MFRLIFLIWILCISICTAQNTVHGTVVNTSNEPIENINVYVEEYGIGDHTNSNGQFSLSQIPSGSFTISLSGLGFQDHSITRSSEDVSDLRIVLVPIIYELEEAEILATWAGEKTPITYKELGVEELKKENVGFDVPFILQWTPSIVVTSDAGNGIGYTGMRIRGTDPTRINVTINGIPLNDSESQGVFWVNLPDLMSSADRVQVQRGVGTSTHGSGAFGATVNVSTLQIENKAFAGISTSMGSFNSKKLNLSFGTGLLEDKFVLEGRLSKIKSDGYIDRSAADLTSLYLSGTCILDRFSLSLVGFHGHEITDQAWWGVPVQNINHETLRTYNPGGQRADGTYHDNQVDDYQQTHYQAHLKTQLSAELNGNLSFNYTKGKGFFEEYIIDGPLSFYGLDDVEVGGESISTTDLIRRRWLDNDYYITTFSLDWRPFGQSFEIIGGGAYGHYNGDHFGEIIWAEYASNSEVNHRYYENTGEKKDFNVFSKINKSFRSNFNGYLDLQYRRVNYTYLGKDSDASPLDQSVQLNFFNPKFGLMYDFSKGWNSYASFAIANREPNRQDYIDSSPNSRPKAERLFNTEIGIRKGSENYNVGFNIYHMLYKDQLVLTGSLNDVGEITRVNVADSYRLGIELDGSWKAESGVFVNGNITLSKNKVDYFEEGIDNWDLGSQDLVIHRKTDLAFSPNSISALEMGYDFWPNNDSKTLELSIQNKFVGKQFIDNTSNKMATIDAYHYTNLKLSYSVKNVLFNDITFRLQVNNLFDKLYESNAWIYRFTSAGYNPVNDDPYARLEDGATYNLTGYYPQAGRNYMLGISLDF